jgi:iron complex transport system substrate-binding protein
MRICSLLPAATEILFAIGAGAEVVGVSHECDFPAEAKLLPRLIRPRVDPSAAPREIDRQVRELVQRGESVYAVDGELLARLAPDLIVTQELCHVCAASPGDLAAALSRFQYSPRVVSFSPGRLEDVWNGIRTLGEETGRRKQAERCASELADRVRTISMRVRDAARRPVLCLEWLDPPYVGGHWVPEMVELAGGEPLLAEAGVPSVALEWERVLASRPETIVLMPCGYGLDRTLSEYATAILPEGWNDLPAVRNGRVFGVDGNSYSSRSGPRLVDGIEILGRAIHPEIGGWKTPAGALAPAGRNGSR